MYNVKTSACLVGICLARLNPYIIRRLFWSLLFNIHNYRFVVNRMDCRRFVFATTLDRARRHYEWQLSHSEGTSPNVKGAHSNAPPAAVQQPVSNIDSLAESIMFMGRAFFESQTTMARSLDCSLACLAKVNIDFNRRVGDLQTSIAKLLVRFAGLLSGVAFIAPPFSSKFDVP